MDLFQPITDADKKERETIRRARLAQARRRCGDCKHWMCSNTCPTESARKAAKKWISAGEYGCNKWEYKGY